MSLDDWAFGDGGFVKIYGDRLAHSSLLECDVATRWVFMFVLSQADASGRYRCASIANLARAAAVTLEQAQRAIAELEAPDPDSTTRDHEGRRLERIPGGWAVLNYARYREFRTKRQIAEAERKRRQREALKARLAELERRVDGAPKDTHPRDMSRDVRGTSAPEGRGQTSDVTDKRTSRPTPSSKAPAWGGWSKEAAEDWQMRFPGSVAPGGRIGKALKPLVRAHAWARVRPAWQAYLRQASAQFATAERFAATWTELGGEHDDLPRLHDPFRDMEDRCDAEAKARAAERGGAAQEGVGA